MKKIVLHEWDLIVYKFIHIFCFILSLSISIVYSILSHFFLYNSIHAHLLTQKYSIFNNHQNKKIPKTNSKKKNKSLHFKRFHMPEYTFAFCHSISLLCYLMMFSRFEFMKCSLLFFLCILTEISLFYSSFVGSQLYV